MAKSTLLGGGSFDTNIHYLLKLTKKYHTFESNKSFSTNFFFFDNYNEVLHAK